VTTDIVYTHIPNFQVGLAFCTLYTFTYRTTWCVFPFTLVAMCWCKFLAQIKCTLCHYCCYLDDNDSEAEGRNEEGVEMAMAHGRNQSEDAIGLAPVEAVSDAPFCLILKLMVLSSESHTLSRTVHRDSHAVRQRPRPIWRQLALSIHEQESILLTECPLNV
jgi:hypothetical protein